MSECCTLYFVVVPTWVAAGKYGCVVTFEDGPGGFPLQALGIGMEDGVDGWLLTQTAKWRAGRKGQRYMCLCLIHFAVFVHTHTHKDAIV